MPRAIPAVVVGLLLAAAAASAAAAPARTVPGWPRVVAAGPVLPGPSGGMVVVSQAAGRFSVTAFRRDGRRLWTDRRVPGCGNCDDGPQPEALQADGTYGPIGYEGDDFWALDAGGRKVEGCAGAVAADGTCTFVRPVLTPAFEGIPSVVVRGPSGVLWSVSEPGLRWFPENDVPPMVVRDDDGRLYAGLAFGRDPATGARERGRLISVDPLARAISWTRIGPYEALTALGAGVLAAREGGVVALAPDGAERWSRSLPRRQTVAPAATAYDAVRGRLYLGRLGTARPGVTAIDATTGRQLWRTRPRDRARLLSVGRGGRVYLAIDDPGRRAVRAVRFRDGRTAWQRRTRLPVLGARELVNGTVAVSAGNRFVPSRADRLTLLDPR